MSDYDVEIQATVRKRIRVTGVVNEKLAIEQAHEMFSVLPEEGVVEKYEQETISCKEAGPA